MHLHRNCPATFSCTYVVIWCTNFRHTVLRCSCLPRRHSNVWAHHEYSIFPPVYLTMFHIHYRWYYGVHIQYRRYVWRPYTVQMIRMASIYIKDGTYGVHIYYRRYVWGPYTLQTEHMGSIFSTNGTYGLQSAIHCEYLDSHSSFLQDAANSSQRQMLSHYRTYRF